MDRCVYPDGVLKCKTSRIQDLEQKLLDLEKVVKEISLRFDTDQTEDADIDSLCEEVSNETRETAPCVDAARSVFPCIQCDFKSSWENWQTASGGVLTSIRFK